MFQANGIWNQAKVGINIPDNADFRLKMVQKRQTSSIGASKVNNTSRLQNDCKHMRIKLQAS